MICPEFKGLSKKVTVQKIRAWLSMFKNFKALWLLKILKENLKKLCSFVKFQTSLRTEATEIVSVFLFKHKTDKRANRLN